VKIWLKRVGFLLVVVLIAIQFVPLARTNPPERAKAPAPEDVQVLLQRACFDCHSNETRWPWYAYVAPVSFLIARDVSEGRREVNFSLWNQYNAQREARKRKEIVEQVQSGKMPQWYYLLLHPDAKLSDADRQTIIKWAQGG
jgi:cytochrome c551/c552